MFSYQAPPQLLAGRNILITGAGRGIGATAAISYARCGATVILCGRTASNLEVVYDQIVAEGLPTPAMIPLDMATTTEVQYQQLAELVASEFNCLHGLLHNASLLGERTPISNYEVHTWNQVMQVNVTAAFQLTQALLPVLQQAQDASIAFTSSGVGNQGRAYWGAYSVSKFAIEGLAQILASELENISNVRVNTINPGATRTNMRAKAYPGEDPMTNPAPEEIMPLYLFLMGPDSIGTTGERFDAQ